MNTKFSNKTINLPLWRGVAIVSGIFAILICTMVIVNYIQINKVDPVNTEVINSLVERLNDNPGDNQLREQIREMDLLVRKAFFTNQWEVRTGAYLLLLSLIVMIIAMQIMRMGKKTLPSVDEAYSQNIISYQQNARKWVGLGGSALVLVTLILAFITHKDLGTRFTDAAKIAKAKTERANEVTPDDAVADKSKEVEKELAGSEVKSENKEIKKTVETPVEETAQAKPVEKVEEAKKTPDAKKYTGQYPSKEMMANFPSFRGPGGNGIAYHKNIPTEWDGASGKNIKWKVTIALHAYNSPVIWGDKLFLSGADANQREVYCYNTQSGKLVWTAKIGQIPGSPDQVPDVTPDTGYAASSLSTDGESVFAIFSNGDLIALDMNGKPVWSKNLGLPDNHYGHSSSLVVFEDKLIVQYDHKKGGKVMAFSTKTGDELWSTARKVKVSWASPVVVKNGDRAEVLLAADPCVASYDALTGEELWKLDCITGEVGPSVAYANGIVFALNEYASLVAIKTGDQPEILWEAYDYLSDVPSPVATDKYLFVVTSYGLVACYDALSGELYWEHEFDNGFYASPILVDGKIYLIDRVGSMHIFKADKEFVSIATSNIGEKTDSTPAFADGHIFIRAGKNLYCIGK
ncbi:outer membrane protein assembly factor BamB [Ancylomarina subtilis]|uniref:Outer membrane protein assembly factor BamB n=1 Tax=Ancylomarina subtilis TaxID=1639035 RepID=A0A4Q7V6S1_9BACT|nr:PQQ-binding-like beta-propeller repeat protein [Ancylomarina subtilis]RZT91257.1 outer membrane protein assembly factor BamB [Ancylomarina subtilis]